MVAALDSTPDYQLGWAERGHNIAALKCEDFCPWGLLIWAHLLLQDIRPQLNEFHLHTVHELTQQVFVKQQLETLC